MVDQSKPQSSTIPCWASSAFSAGCIKRVSEAVANAERKTSAEIVTVVARSSLDTAVIRKLFVSYALSLYLLIVICLISSHLLNLSEHLISQVGVVVGGITILFLPWPLKWRRLLFNEDELSQLTFEAAKKEFFASRIFSTQGQTGVLLFFSLIERRVVILCDKAISSVIPQDSWDGYVSEVVRSMKQRNPEEALVRIIDDLGEKLSQTFPVREGDQNELADALVFKE